VSETVAAMRDVTHRVNLSVARNVEHYHGERNHQGLGNELIDGAPAGERVGRIRRCQRLGGPLNYYARAE
jgi:hypothetical protein